MAGNSATKAKNKYNAANYDRIPVQAKKGLKEEIEKAAEQADLSRNAYIIEAVMEKMKRDGFELNIEEAPAE